MQQLSKKSKLWVGAAAVLLAGGLFYGAVEYMEAQIKPVEAQTPADVKKVLEAANVKRSGCRSAEDFVNMNIMLRHVSNEDLFNAVLSGLRFENGRVVYPDTAEQPHELMLVKKFFTQVNITNEKELKSCIMFVREAKAYHESKRVMVARAVSMG